MSMFLMFKILQETYGFTLSPVKGEDRRRFAHFAAGGAAFDASQGFGGTGFESALGANVADLTFSLRPLPVADVAVFERFAAGLPAPTLPDPAFEAHIKAASRVL
jgi:hypothetical protein